MSEHSEAIVATKPPATQQPDLLSSVRQLVYAWVGLWGVAAEDLGKFYQRCVARGEQVLNAQPPPPPVAEKPPVSEVAVTAPKKPTPKRVRPTSIFNAFGAVESYHIDLNAEGLLPTKEEVDALSARIEALAREVEALTPQRAS